MTPFHRALAHTLAAEGWYTDSGPTYRGIDRRHWPECERDETFIQKCKVAR